MRNALRRGAAPDRAMVSLVRALALAAVIVACRHPVLPPSPPRSPALAVDAPTAGPDTPAVDPRITLLHDLGAGRARLVDHVDPARGLLVVEYVDAGPGPEGRAVRRARRLCRDDLARDTELPAMVRAALSQAESFGIGCADETCTVAGMEFAPVWRVGFEGPRLHALLRLSEAAMPAEGLATRDAWVRTQVATLRAQPCPGGGR